MNADNPIPTRQDMLIHLADLLGIHLEEVTYLVINETNEQIMEDIRDLESAREFSLRAIQRMQTQCR